MGQAIFFFLYWPANHGNRFPIPIPIAIPIRMKTDSEKTDTRDAHSSNCPPHLAIEIDVYGEVKAAL
jgi:hypothetical protein